jgi:large subunit ribosomal protein L16
VALLQPSSRKFRKDRKGNKGKIRNITYSGATLDKGIFGLKALEPGRITAAQIESLRVIIKRALKKEGKIFVRIFPHKPITKKPAEVRMGNGKGNLEYWVAIVEPGRILFELDSVSEELAKKAFDLVSYKLNIKTSFIRRII